MELTGNPYPPIYQSFWVAKGAAPFSKAQMARGHVLVSLSFGRSLLVFRWRRGFPAAEFCPRVTFTFSLPEFLDLSHCLGLDKFESIGVRFGCFGGKIDGPGLHGGLIIYQGHLFS